MKNQAINDTQDNSNLPSTIFSKYPKYSEFKITLNITSTNVISNIRNILDYVKSSPEDTIVPEFKDILVVSNDVKEINATYPDIATSTINELVIDFEALLINNLESPETTLSNVYTKYDTKVIIIDLTLPISSVQMKLVHLLDMICNMVIELKVTENTDSVASTTIEPEDSNDQHDSIDWLLHYYELTAWLIQNANTNKKPKVLYQRYVDAYVHVYSFKHFKSILSKFSNINTH